MPEKKPVIGLSWQPQLPFPSLSKATNDPSHAQLQAKAPSSTIWKPNSELVNGLFVPPNDPKKLNKLLRQQVKDTAGKQWYDLKQVLPFLNATKTDTPPISPTQNSVPRPNENESDDEVVQELGKRQPKKPAWMEDYVCG
ncbi:hypothetical protein KIW84_073441 [Lathyrus oleraceus]|uniref:Uncharacterized protein n=1 Tax=Pisum sativum TaxID=3888 RepID=A0A9D4ZYM4_PEA|nr:hypothetical protein KIW84_073441 [Pisum sativum]